MIVLGETSSRQAPSLADCNAYASAKGISPSQMFMDNTNNDSFYTIFSYINNYASGSFGIPWDALLDGTSMEYVFSDTAGGEGSFEEVLQGLYEKFASMAE